MYTKRFFHVFLSCAGTDLFVARMCAKLIKERSQGAAATFLYDKSIEGGQAIPDEVRRSIQECDEFLLLLTPDSVNRQWVMIELGAALAFEKRIVAILHHIGPKKIPEIMQSKKAFNLNDFDSLYLKELLHRVRDHRR